MSTDVERLQQIRDAVHQNLEQQITDLMTKARTIRELSQLLDQNDSEIRRTDSLKEKVDVELSKSSGNSEYSKQAGSLQLTLTRLQKTRSELIERLEAASRELGAERV